MKYELVLTDSAAHDLVSVVEFIAKDSIACAHSYHDGLVAKLKLLENEPLLGRAHSTKKFRHAGYRELVMLSHIAHYTIDKANGRINIIRV